MIIRGVLHVHSLYSYDGKMTLSQLREVFLAQGLSFVCITEHSDFMTTESSRALIEECRNLSDDRFIFIPGFEVPHHNAHVLMIDCDTFFSQRADTADVLAEWVGRSGFVVLAHPHRNNFKVSSDLERVLGGVEIWNSQYDGKIAPRYDAVKYLHALRVKRKSLVATGGLDLHRAEHTRGPAIEMDVDRLYKDAVVDNLKRGRFTLVGAGVRLGGQEDVGAFLKSFYYRVVGAGSVAFIQIGKGANSFLRKLGIRLPQWARRCVRKYI